MKFERCTCQVITGGSLVVSASCPIHIDGSAYSEFAPAAALVERATPIEPPCVGDSPDVQKLLSILEPQCVEVSRLGRTFTAVAWVDVESAIGAVAAVADRATAPAPLRNTLEVLIAEWRAAATTTCNAHEAARYEQCANEIDAALRALPSRRETGEK